MHDTQIEQSQEVYAFLKSKFTNADLYTWTSGQLMRLYREGYQLGAQVARQAESAYRFERDSSALFIQPDNWDSGHSGLLAGERLLLQISQMEKTFLDNNTRDIGVSQSFSLLQIDPSALEGVSGWPANATLRSTRRGSTCSTPGNTAGFCVP